jgi:hypothetical protein
MVVNTSSLASATSISQRFVRSATRAGTSLGTCWMTERALAGRAEQIVHGQCDERGVASWGVLILEFPDAAGEIELSGDDTIALASSSAQSATSRQPNKSRRRSNAASSPAPRSPTRTPKAWLAPSTTFGNLSVSPLRYRLRSWEFAGEDRTFWSYTGVYNDGDRIVAAPGETLTVLKVEQQATPVEDGVLLVERERKRREWP